MWGGNVRGKYPRGEIVRGEMSGGKCPGGGNVLDPFSTLPENGDEW